MARRLPNVISWRGFKLSRNWDPSSGRMDEWRGYANLTHSGPSLGLIVRRTGTKWKASLRTPDMVEPRAELGLWGKTTPESPQLALDMALDAWQQLIERVSRGASGWAGVI